MYTCLFSLITSWCNVYTSCVADHVQEVVAHHVVALSEVGLEVAARVVVGHAVVPAVLLEEVPVVRSHSRRSVHHIHRNTDHVHQNVDPVRQNVDPVRQSKRSSLRKTIVVGVQVRSAILRLLTVKLLVSQKRFSKH